MVQVIVAVVTPTDVLAAIVEILGALSLTVTVMLDEAKEGLTAKIFVARPLAVDAFFPSSKSSGDDER